MQTIPDGHDGFSGVKTGEEWKVVAEPRRVAAPPQAHLAGDIRSSKMFSCCRPTSGGSGSQVPQGCRLFQCCRLWLQHKNQRLRAFIRRRHQVTQSPGSCHGRSCCPQPPRARAAVCAPSPGLRAAPCRLHFPSVPPQGARASAGKGPPICPTKPSRTELLEQEFQQLLPALLRRDVISVFMFLDECHGFATTEEVAATGRFMGCPPPSSRYGCIAGGCGGNDAVLQPWKLAMCCILEIWVDYYRQDLCQLREFASLKKILEFLRQRMPGTDVELRARRYLQQLRRLHAVEPEAGGEEPAASVGPEVIEAILTAGAEGSAPAEVPAGEAKPLQIVVTALVPAAPWTSHLHPRPPGRRSRPRHLQAGSPECQSRHLPLEQLASIPEQPPDHLGSPPQLPPRGS
ncbi:unnamed protein product [Nyctereutes procyonoides]|uniref:(raccoon dog) hypothetical protein n=1 Tax=Nyctereutes procyonoides TaxID=34880 RepID=A0A811XVA0_NYCPR|nr:unnamed protein product [Nyctereutes procyonoides]